MDHSETIYFSPSNNTVHTLGLPQSIYPDVVEYKLACLCNDREKELQNRIDEVYSLNKLLQEDLDKRHDYYTLKKESEGQKLLLKSYAAIAKDSVKIIESMLIAHYRPKQPEDFPFFVALKRIQESI